MKKGESFLLSNVGWLILAVIVVLVLIFLAFKGRDILSSFLSIFN